MDNIKLMENFHFNCLQGMYFSNIVQTDWFTLLSSDLIEDTYYNYCAQININEELFEGEWYKIREYFIDINRIPSLYITPSSDLYCSNILNKYNLKKQYTDAWMIMDNPEILLNQKINSNISIIKVNSSDEFNTFVNTFYGAYSGDDPNDPYSNLSPTYVHALRKSNNIKDLFNRNHYIASLNGMAVGVATAIESNGIVAIYNVGTIAQYRNNGVGKALISKIVNDFAFAKLLFLQTEYGSYVEKWYQNMGYKTVFLGECYSN